VKFISSLTIAAVTCTFVSAYAEHTTTAAQATFVYLNRNGQTVRAGDGHGAGTLPAYGGSDEEWHKIVDCVRDRYADFNVDVLTKRPPAAIKVHYATIVVGGWASDVGLSNKNYNGIAPYHKGRTVLDGIALVFSKVGPHGEHDIENVCAAIVHESAHMIGGLDHELKCGDVMGYALAKCGPRRFIDEDAPCGETTARTCGNGQRVQNSYHLLGSRVGFRSRDESP
jgi:hypothetical protein